MRQRLRDRHATKEILPAPPGGFVAGALVLFVKPRGQVLDKGVLGRLSGTRFKSSVDKKTYWEVLHPGSGPSWRTPPCHMIQEGLIVPSTPEVASHRCGRIPGQGEDSGEAEVSDAVVGGSECHMKTVARREVKMLSIPAGVSFEPKSGDRARRPRNADTELSIHCLGPIGTSAAEDKKADVRSEVDKLTIPFGVTFKPKSGYRIRRRPQDARADIDLHIACNLKKSSKGPRAPEGASYWPFHSAAYTCFECGVSFSKCSLFLAHLRLRDTGKESTILKANAKVRILFEGIWHDMIFCGQRIWHDMIFCGQTGISTISFKFMSPCETWSTSLSESELPLRVRVNECATTCYLVSVPPTPTKPHITVINNWIAACTGSFGEQVLIDDAAASGLMSLIGVGPCERQAESIFMPGFYRVAYDAIGDGRLKSDFTRLVALVLHGGWYRDNDMNPLDDPSSVYDSNADLVLVSSVLKTKPHISMGFMYSRKPRNPILAAILGQWMASFKTDANGLSLFTKKQNGGCNLSHPTWSFSFLLLNFLRLHSTSMLWTNRRFNIQAGMHDCGSFGAVRVYKEHRGPVPLGDFSDCVIVNDEKNTPMIQVRAFAWCSERCEFTSEPSRYEKLDDYSAFYLPK